MPATRWPRTILHADMDAFYAAVEQHDRPELRGLPVLVGHPGPRSVVTTASYEARPFGVGSAMPMSRARRLCPQAIVVPPRFDRYQEVSGVVMATFARFSPSVEPLSLDEAFLDLTGTEDLHGPPATVGRALRAAVRTATGLAVSVGIAPSKFVAKVASDVCKPDGLKIVLPGEVAAFLEPLPVTRLFGVGAKGAERLHRLGLRSIADVARAEPAWLTAHLGALGAHIAALARGDDPRPVVPDRDARSVGHESTLETDVLGRAAIRPHLRTAADVVARHLRADGLVAGGVRVKLKTRAFQLVTRQTTLATPTDASRALYDAAEPLLDACDLSIPMRLVGLAAFALAPAAAPRQGDLFAAPADAKARRLDQTLDTARGKFGRRAIRRASDLEA